MHEFFNHNLSWNHGTIEFTALYGHKLNGSSPVYRSNKISCYAGLRLCRVKAGNVELTAFYFYRMASLTGLWLRDAVHVIPNY